VGFGQGGEEKLVKQPFLFFREKNVFVAVVVVVVDVVVVVVAAVVEETPPVGCFLSHEWH